MKCCPECGHVIEETFKPVNPFTNDDFVFIKYKESDLNILKLFTLIHPVTADQYEAVMEKSPVEIPLALCPPMGCQTMSDVSWEDAKEFCRILNNITPCSEVYRLPFEAEWEDTCICWFDVHDMHGNRVWDDNWIWEWCEDSDSVFPNKRVIKGGDFTLGYPERCFAKRSALLSARRSNIGFRVMREIL